jgi:hypothetical protein
VSAPEQRLHAPALGVIACLAEPAALERLPCPVGACALRVAADELHLWCGPDVRARVRAEAVEALAAHDPSGMALDVSAGWAARLLLGPGARAAFAALVEHDPGEAERAFVQGAVRGVPARTLLGPDFALMLFLSLAVNTFDRLRPAGWRIEGLADGSVLDRILGAALTPS